MDKPTEAQLVADRMNKQPTVSKGEFAKLERRFADLRRRIEALEAKKTRRKVNLTED